jgi:flagellar biogenesis protein FliO
MLKGFALQLATATSTPWQAGGFSWWQALGALLVVFALLLLVLRLLARWQSGSSSQALRLLKVVPLGRGRELQILRLRDRVHYLYRQDGALVLLESEPYATYRSTAPLREAQAAGPLAALRERLAGLLHPELDSAVTTAVGEDPPRS